MSRPALHAEVKRRLNQNPVGAPATSRSNFPKYANMEEPMSANPNIPRRTNNGGNGQRGNGVKQNNAKKHANNNKTTTKGASPKGGTNLDKQNLLLLRLVELISQFTS